MNLFILYEQFAGAIVGKTTFRGETTLTVDRDAIVAACRFLRDQEACAFEFLTDLCGLDLWPATPRFAVVYHLFSPHLNQRLRLKVFLPAEDPVVDSAVPVWETADWHERECFDLFGIRFRNHPDLRRILLADDFEGHPLRKDFPLEGTVSS
ncbi:MAG: NADH-quinone oxidoreductase subunit C [Syntrophales bacterium]